MNSHEDMDELITLNDESEECRLCNLKKVDEFKFGPLFQREGFVAHYYCVLFSNNIQQRGEDNEGIMGFLVEDVKAEVNRVKRSLCYYCKKPYATVHCARKKCKIKFHYPCGVAKGSLHQFQGSFKSYCFSHRPIQEIPKKLLKEAEADQIPCAICYDTIDYRSKTDTIWANCCCTTWYHRDCLQKHALSSGYFFKCAICNNNGKFKTWVEKYGIFVPQKDASWELEPNAFGELTRQYSQCDAHDCKCPDGRECDVVDTMWEIILCRSCGSQGMHIMCGQLKFHRPVWQCQMCKNVISQYHSKRKKCKIRDGLTNNSQDTPKVPSMRLVDDDGPTSSGGERTSLESSENDGSNKQVRKKAKKRKRAEAEDGEKPRKGKHKRSRTVTRHDSEQFCSGKEAMLNRDMDALHIKMVENQNNNNEANERGKSPAVESNSAEDEDSDDGFTLEEIRRRKKIEEEGLQVIDLSNPNLSKEEANNIIEVYRNLQNTDVKYRVKKVVLVVSDDEADDSEVEVILDDKPKPPDLNITVHMALKATVDGKTTEEDASGESEVDSGVTDVGTDTPTEAVKARGEQEEKRLDSSCVPADTVPREKKRKRSNGGRDSGDTVSPKKALRERTIEPKVLESFQTHIQALIDTATKNMVSSHKRQKLNDGSSISGRGDNDGEDDIEVIEVVRSNRRSLRSFEGCSGSAEEIIEIE